MISGKSEHPYFEAWLRRTGRQLSASGRLSQIATVLAAENDGDTEHWRSLLLSILQGERIPSPDLLTRIDSLLMRSNTTSHEASAHQESLF